MGVSRATRHLVGSVGVHAVVDGLPVLVHIHLGGYEEGRLPGGALCPTERERQGRDRQGRERQGRERREGGYEGRQRDSKGEGKGGIRRGGVCAAYWAKASLLITHPQSGHIQMCVCHLSRRAVRQGLDEDR